ncbi:hypothetical protein CEXT_638121 [Caerostris extrusa]|uniref:Uncharacterized protein n=1 Tax=Caerostris extrusa TaxID=172846 RepID=A0AAV4PY53_CAEEX|nr:hypothetical protein CEXT_638121 [Caerostris extrusa]
MQTHFTFCLHVPIVKKSSWSPGQSPQDLGMSDFIQCPFLTKPYFDLSAIPENGAHDSMVECKHIFTFCFSRSHNQEILMPRDNPQGFGNVRFHLVPFYQSPTLISWRAYRLTLFSSRSFSLSEFPLRCSEWRGTSFVASIWKMGTQK